MITPGQTQSETLRLMGGRCWFPHCSMHHPCRLLPLVPQQAEVQLMMSMAELQQALCGDVHPAPSCLCMAWPPSSIFCRVQTLSSSGGLLIDVYAASCRWSYSQPEGTNFFFLVLGVFPLISGLLAVELTSLDVDSKMAFSVAYHGFTAGHATLGLLCFFLVFLVFFSSFFMGFLGFLGLGSSSLSSSDDVWELKSSLLLRWWGGGDILQHNCHYGGQVLDGASCGD